MPRFRSFLRFSPKLLAGRNRLLRPADVLKWPLLRLEDQSKAWERWFALAGVVAPEQLPGPVLNRASMLIDAAVDGQGIALARTTLAAWDLISGRIVRPFDLSWQPAGTYWIVLSESDGEGRENRPLPRLAAGGSSRRRPAARRG